MTNEKERNPYLRFPVIAAVVMIALMYNANTSSFTTLISSVAGEMLRVDMKPTQIGWLISITSLFMIPGVLLSGWLTTKFSMRNIMITGWIIFGISGAAIYFMHTTMGILACRSIMGFAIGVAQPSSRALPSRMYSGQDRKNVMGYITFGGGVISMATSIIFGRIGLIGWRYAMFVYPVYAAIFITFALLFVPNLPAEPRLAASSEGKKRPLGFATWVMIFCGFYCFLIGAVIQIKTSTFISEMGLGGSDVAGIVSACNTAGNVVAGLVFGWLYKKLDRWLYPVALTVTTAAYFAFANATSVVVLCISGAIICGSSIGIVMAYNVARVTFTAPKERVTNAITIITMATYIGQVLTTPLVNWVHSVWGDSSRVALMFVGCAFGALAVAAYIFVLATRKMKLNADD